MPTPPRPLVVLPGLMASRLYFLNSRISWDPDSYWEMLKWFLQGDFGRSEILRYDNPAGVIVSSDDINNSQELRGWGTVVWSYYADFIEDMERTRGNVWVVGYDWRQNIETNLAAYLKAKLLRIEGLTGQHEFVVVAHSMGSLVLRMALQNDATLQKLVKAIIYICPPVVGAPVLYRRLFTGMMPRYDTGFFFRWLIGDSEAGFCQNASGLPGPMQLLPSVYYPHNIGGANYWNSFLPGIPHSQLYSNPNRPPGIRIDGLAVSNRAKRHMLNRITDIDNFHTNLGDPNVNIPIEKDSYLIYGNKRQTDVRIIFPCNYPQAIRDIEGDETVPIHSATAMKLPGRTTELKNIIHAEACNDPKVRKAVKDILRNGNY